MLFGIEVLSGNIFDVGVLGGGEVFDIEVLGGDMFDTEVPSTPHVSCAAFFPAPTSSLILSNDSGSSRLSFQIRDDPVLLFCPTVDPAHLHRASTGMVVKGLEEVGTDLLSSLLGRELAYSMLIVTSGINCILTASIRK